MELLTNPLTREIHQPLQPLFNTLIASERPQNTIYWLRRPPGVGPHLLRQMAIGDLDISHAAFDTLPSDRAHNYLRELLTAISVLPPHEPGITRMRPWLEQRLATLPADDARLVNQFARWRVLRRLREKAERASISRGDTDRARQQINNAIHLLDWLRGHDTTMDAAVQSDLDRYLTEFPQRRYPLHAFVTWLPPRPGRPRLVLPLSRQQLPTVTVSDEQRWRGVEILLHDESVRLYTRVAGLFMLLFAQQLTTICQMRTEQVLLVPDRVLVTFDREPVEMPPILDQLVRQQAGRRGRATYASRDSGWLFPGGIPGRPLQTENVRTQLVERGIKPLDNRKAALFQLAATMPTPVLTDLLGVSTSAAMRWVALSSRDWSGYVASR